MISYIGTDIIVSKAFFWNMVRKRAAAFQVWNNQESLKFRTCTVKITIFKHIWIDGSRLRHVGSAVVPRFETCGKRVKKQGFIHRQLFIFFCFINARFVGCFSWSFLRTESELSLFGADSLSRSVDCAPDENDGPSEQTKIFKLTSVYGPVYISELTRT